MVFNNFTWPQGSLLIQFGEFGAGYIQIGYQARAPSKGIQPFLKLLTLKASSAR